MLITIDRHEWYTPPQLYTRNDSSGLWDAKSAIEPASVSPSIGNNGLPISQDISLCHHDTEPMHEVNVRGVTDTASIMEASSGDGSQNDFGSEAKKQRVEDDSLDGIAANGSSYGEFKSGDAMATDNTVLRDFEGATALSANASLAERAIEPALVMFEVKTKTFLKVISFTSCWNFILLCGVLFLTVSFFLVLNGHLIFSFTLFDFSRFRVATSSKITKLITQSSYLSYFSRTC